MKKLVLAAALLTLPIGMVYADKKEQGSGPNPYVECGIGAALFPDTGWAAVTSNATWDLGTTAITSAFSSPETCNAKKKQTAKLIMETLEGLEKDIANGGGTTTVALAQTMGCAEANQAAFVNELRKQYGAVVAHEGYAEQTKGDRALKMYSSVKGAASVADASCAASL